MGDSKKGGRGKRAPYQTTHARIPEALKPLCEELTANYRELVDDYLDPEDPALITAALLATGGNLNTNDFEVQKKADALLRHCTAMQLEIDRLNEQIEILKSTVKKDSISKAIISFIESEKVLFGKSGSQKDKEFSINTRRWDAFKSFIKFVNTIEDPIFWKVGDKCSVTMPSGVKVSGGEIASIDRKRSCCKVLFKDTESHFSAELSSLSKP